MDHSSRLRRIVVTSVAGAGMASAIAVGGVATAAPAAPMHPAPHSSFVPGTKCSVAQVERALAKEDPALWKRIDTHPRVKKHFESMIMMTPQQRHAKRAEWKKSHPTESAMMRFLRDHGVTPREMKKDHKALRTAMKTCEKY